MTILIFLGVLFVLILVHEWGHFIVAKKTGMQVDEFAIGFPPKLFGVTKGGTTYTINLLPIGGFVRIYGENAEDASLDAKAGADISKSFTSKSKWAQCAVLIAGITMNILFAWFLFVIVFTHGVPTVVEEGSQGQNATLVVTHVLPKSPADKAGITVGSTILSYGETTTAPRTPSAFKSFTSTHNGQAVSLVIKTKKGDTKVSVTPITGLVTDDATLPAIGVALSLVETVSKPFHVAVIEATKTTFNSLLAITKGLGSLLVHIVHRNADLSQVAGPVGMVKLVGEAAEFGFSSLLMFTAIISLNLAVINLLPVPALDGGRLVFVLIEAIIRRPINPIWVARVNTTGFVLLLLLMAAVTYSDIGKLF